jgi:hypothetical protein
MRVTSVTQDVNKRDSVNDTPLSYACEFLMRTHERVLIIKFFQRDLVKTTSLSFCCKPKLT